MNERHIKKNSKNRTDLAKLHKLDDRDIDYSDNPATNEDFWKDAKIVMPTHKVHLSLRLDDDIVEHFKKQGAGYQSKINAVLKAYVHSKEHH